jgi:hypothetical protein
MTKHQMKARYPASSATVIRMMTDKAFHVAKLEKLGLSKYEVLDHQFDGKQFSIRIERKVPVQMPGMKKSAGESTVVNEEKWDVAARTGSVAAHPQGMPLEISAVTAMADDGDGCVVTYDWNIHAKIPLVGGQLEKFVIGDMESRAAEETRVAVELLADYR